MQMVKLFANGQSQAVRLPKDCRFNGEEICAQKVGEAVLLFPKNRAWATFMEGINSFSEDYFEAIETARKNELDSPRETL